MNKTLVGLAVAVSLILIAMPERDVQAFCNDFHIFGIDVNCDGGGHPVITDEGLSFMWPRIRTFIANNNVEQDRGGNADDVRRHFDSCRFREGAEYVNRRHDDIVELLNPTAADNAGAMFYFGRLLHPVQDFYAHSNWLQLVRNPDGTYPPLLVAGTTGYWDEWPVSETEPFFRLNDNIMIGELPTDAEGVPYLPNGYVIYEPLDSDVPTITTPGNADFRALITGWNPPGKYPDDTDGGDGACIDARPDTTTDSFGTNRTGKLVHGLSADNRPCESDYPTYVCLNRDEDGRPDFRVAFNYALLQTQAEWCRMLHLLKDGYGNYDAASIPLALWVRWDSPGSVPPSTPHPSGTACGRDESHSVKGPVGVTVSVPTVEELPQNFSSDLWGLPLVTSFVAYTGDFRDSARTLSDPVFFGSSPRSGLVAPRTLCLAASDTLVVTLQGWGDDGNGAYEPFAALSLGLPYEPSFRGVTKTLQGPTFGAGILHAQASDDIRATFNVSLETADDDEDGLPDLCGEAYYGTSAASSDTDGDGLLDGTEVNTYGTNPAVSDTDSDGVTDGTEVTGANQTNPLLGDTDSDGLLDGVEDANHNGGRDTGETDPNNPDTDTDVLTDGCEVTGSNPTQPLVADSDGDGLLDGLEDRNHDCGLTAGETDPNDADSDDDLLADGLEVAFGTDPLNPDSDQDGIPDGQDTEWVQTAIGTLPGSAFKDGSRGLQTSMTSILDGIETSIAAGRITQAKKMLQDLIKRVDGCGAVADRTEWIVDCSVQVTIRSYLNLLMDALGP